MTRASNSNADLLKQSIRSEKVIKSSLNQKTPQDLEAAQSQATPSQRQSQRSAQGENEQEGQDQSNSVVNLPGVSEPESSQSAKVQVEEDDTSATAAATGTEANEVAAAQDNIKSLDDIKTVTLVEKPKATPKSIKSKKMKEVRLESHEMEETKTTNSGMPHVRPLDRTLPKSPIQTMGSGGNVGVASSQLMHEEDEEVQDSYNITMVMD